MKHVYCGDGHGGRIEDEDEFEGGQMEYEATPTSSYKFKRPFLEMGRSIQNKQKTDEELSCQEYNLLLFSELGRGKLKEEIVRSLPLLNLCVEVIADIDNKNEVITSEKKVQILGLFSSCNWLIRAHVLTWFLYKCGDVTEDSDEEDGGIANLLPQHLLEFKEGITGIIPGLSKEYFFKYLFEPKVRFDVG